jgi:hypothetical protein
MIETKLDLTPWKEHFGLGVADDAIVGGKSRCICYKKIPLWRCGDPDLTKVRFLVLGGDTEDAIQEPYSLACNDHFDDYYTYGDWMTLDEVKVWLENPVSLY